MSIVVRFTPESPPSADVYDKTIRDLEEQGDFPPEGLEYHVAFYVDGKLAVSEIWSSQEQFEAFGERLMPILEANGVDPGEPAILEAHNTISGA